MIEIAEELLSRDGLGMALVERALSFLELGQVREANESAERAVALLDETGSGVRWRGYHVLGLVLDAQVGPGDSSREEEALAAMQRSVDLLEDLYKQIDASDEERRALITRAHSGPARDLRMMLDRQGRKLEAAIISRRWMLDEAEARFVSKA